MTPNRWLVLLVLFLARTAMGFQFQSIASVSPLLVKDLAIELAALGALVGAWMLPGVVVAIPGGLLGQRFGDKRAVLCGLALMALGSGLVAVSETYGGVLAGRVVSGTGAVLLNVLLTKMVSDWFAGPQLATAMGILVVSWPAGIGLSLLLLGPLAVGGSWRLAIAVTAVVCVAACVCVALVYQRPPVAPGATPPPAPRWRLGRRELSLTLIAGAVWALYNVGYIIVVTFSPVLLAEQGFGASNAAMLSSLATWPMAVTIPLGGVLADATGRGKAIMLGCFAAMAVAMPLMLFGPSPLVMLAVIGALAGPAAGIIMALPARALSPASRHLGMGIFYAVYYLAMAVLPGVAGALRGLTGIGAAPLLFGSLLLLGAAVCVGLFDVLARRPQAAVA